MKIHLVTIISLFALNSAIAGGPTMPEDWRMPTSNELSDEWRSGKYKNAQAIGDFNGDGLIEGAFLAVSRDGKYEGLLAFVYLGGKEQWFVLSKNNLSGSVFMGLDLYKPGKYKVLCETEIECNKAYKKEIEIKNDSFVFYRPESASSIFVWDKTKNQFDRIWESD